MKKNLIILIIIAILATIMYFVSGRFQTQNQPIPCTLEARICPDGSAVGRSGPNCEFAPCPTLAPSQKAICGGIAGIKCPEGYICQLDGNYPDATGICVNKTSPVELYECPKGDYVDCMPGPDRLKKTKCTPQYLQWAEENCPNFKGAAY